MHESNNSTIIMKDTFLSEKTKSRKEGDGSTSESINKNKKACSSYR